MSEDRNSAWLRKTLCDEIEAVRAGKSDHLRAKAVAMLSREVIKSVEVEMVFRQQQAEMSGTEHAQLGALPLCQPALPAPETATEATAEQEPEAEAESEPEVEPEVEPEPELAASEKDITQINEFKVGDRVECPSGKLGTIKSMTSSGRITVAEDTGGTFPYTARHLTAAPVEREQVRSPLVPSGARFVPGRYASGSR